MPSTHPCWLQERAAGALLHISSLPGCHGIGNLGTPAIRFLDFLAEAGLQYWQICPVGPTGYGDSPYQSFSSFAGNAYFLDLKPLIKEGLLEPEETAPLRALPQDHVDYGGLYTEFWGVLQLAWKRFQRERRDLFDGRSFREFRERNASWLDGYAAFMGLKAWHDGRPWPEWELPWRRYEDVDPAALPAPVREVAEPHRFYQFLFYTQWEQLRAAAADRGIRIIGDLPIFTSLDSADCWQFAEVFRLDADGQPLAVAGVPPDYFSEKGQFWGNPLYDWDYLRSTDYAWWVQRLGHAFACYDVLRLDHFRAFDTYWEIPAGTDDPREGTMREGPGQHFFERIGEQLPRTPIIAEDLGYITRGVVELRRHAGLPGMKVLQFGYGHDDNNVNLPHFHQPEAVVYTGTHDNDTTRGWLRSLSPEQAEATRRYYSLPPDADSAWPFLKAACASVARLAILPVQDLLDLGSEARFNRPGTSEGNWRWRLREEQLERLRREAAPRLREYRDLFDRTGDQRQREYSAPPGHETTASPS